MDGVDGRKTIVFFDSGSGGGKGFQGAEDARDFLDVIRNKYSTSFENRFKCTDDIPSIWLRTARTLLALSSGFSSGFDGALLSVEKSDDFLE